MAVNIVQERVVPEFLERRRVAPAGCRNWTKIELS
jgi:hypothetical protein